MSRKDTIIIAVLINAGLLAVLFMLAINTEEESISDQAVIRQAVVENQPFLSSHKIEVPIALAGANIVDEVDNFLKDLGSAELVQPGFIDDEGIIDLENEARASAKKPIQDNVKPLSSTQYVEVTVKRGDALEKMARNNGTTVEAIKNANNLTTSKLVIGQVLRIPITNKAPEQTIQSTKNTNFSLPKTPEQKPSTPIEAQYYTIKSGDNPWKIAKQYQVKFEELLKLNGLDEEKARNLKVGDKIRVR